ncbi:type II secretion system F family protein [Desulfovibrio inopinatus]|uniref:type II secretion system F family protein n=1 Tax=Desulfovibrio inopinatus TaxID=102109 RepID=UPI000403A9FE|nr:type II secretion system F family protein [Desulfovibrio inopinatus]
MASPLLIAGLVCIAVLLAVYALLGIFEEQKQRDSMRNRLREVSEHIDINRKETSASWLHKSFMLLFARLGESVKPKKKKDLGKAESDLMHAGFRSKNAVAVFWGFKIGLALFGMTACLVTMLIFMGNVSYEVVAIVTLAVTLLFLYLPGVWLNWRISVRKDNISRGLPDALDLLVVCVEAGMGLDAAIDRVGMEMRAKCQELSDELKMLSLELRAGKARREALKNLAERIGIDDVNSLVALLIQADIFGTSVALTLRVYADTMRTKRFQRAEEQAAKLPVKLLFPLIFFILPPLFIVIMGPAVIRLMKVFNVVGQ